MINIGIRLKNPTIVLTPIDESAKKDFGFASVYVLYKNEKGEIEIGIPDMVNYSNLANMSGFEIATEKGYFYCGGSTLENQADKITDAPVYEIEPTDERTVGSYRIINSVDIPLETLLAGEKEKSPQKNK